MLSGACINHPLMPIRSPLLTYDKEVELTSDVQELSGHKINHTRVTTEEDLMDRHSSCDSCELLICFCTLQMCIFKNVFQISSLTMQILFALNIDSEKYQILIPFVN